MRHTIKLIIRLATWAVYIGVAGLVLWEKPKEVAQCVGVLVALVVVLCVIGWGFEKD